MDAVAPVSTNNEYTLFLVTQLLVYYSQLINHYIFFTICKAYHRKQYDTINWSCEAKRIHFNKKTKLLLEIVLALLTYVKSTSIPSLMWNYSH